MVGKLCDGFWNIEAIPEVIESSCQFVLGDLDQKKLQHRLFHKFFYHSLVYHGPFWGLKRASHAGTFVEITPPRGQGRAANALLCLLFPTTRILYFWWRIK